MTLVALAFVVIAQAQLPSTPRDVGEARQFMQDAATGGTTDVELGPMAANKAASAPVRAFAERMVKDHGTANDELMELARKKGVSLSIRLDAKHQAVVDRLGRLSGPEFDREYMQATLRQHLELAQETARGTSSTAGRK